MLRGDRYKEIQNNI